MTNNIATLYPEMIIEHARRPRNFGELDGATCTLDGVNPLCGDELTLYLKINNDEITGISFKGSGCAISQASASLMTPAVKGLKLDEALAFFARIHAMLTTEPDGEVITAELGKLAVLSGVWEYPTRVKCATLAWQTLRRALTETVDGSGESRK